MVALACPLLSGAYYWGVRPRVPKQTSAELGVNVVAVAAVQLPTAILGRSIAGLTGVVASALGCWACRLAVSPAMARRIERRRHAGLGSAGARR
ncbi:hypothetical protein SAMN05421810_11212 [Amycolatopsis arida]|uniref:Uncharacterized protein n=1 Tax=Amycolatopsis arida TaxID=587909 RepID=A0A1I6ACT1_9PSEU|nr:hypothetical protein [Amycolatopsis arida]TDX97634.1 hypothetical protein CLV69_102738 [Amycolatopsis arida]SFQ66479.1 hypothetical protein SAMN05421810_11212 [Amycolatopsis arida]